MGVTFHIFSAKRSCLDCQHNCVKMPNNCNCAQYGGGECAYIQNGLLKKCYIDKVIQVV